MQTSQETQSSPPQLPQLAGFDDVVRTMMQEWKVQGLGIALVKDGEIVLLKGYGKRNVADDLDVTPDTLFAIGSCTKAFTTAALGILVDEGKLDWDTPVKHYIPSFRLQDDFATERMTPRDLVCHRSGLPRHDTVWYGSTRSRKELFDRLQYLEPSKDFRTFWQYQNLMYMTAGYLIEVVSGQTWEAFVQQRILTPLGMERSNYSVVASQQTSDFSLPYKEEKDEVQRIDFYNDEAFASVAPAGAINSSVAEMSKWLLMHMNKGKVGETQIVSEAQLLQMHAPQMVIPDPRKYTELSTPSYGLGWFIHSYRGHLFIEHGGNIDGFSALTAFFPDDKIGMVILSNMEATPVPVILCYTLADRFLGLEPVDWHGRIKQEYDEMKAAIEKGKEKSGMDRVADTQPSHALDAYTGDYEHPAYDTLTIEREDDHLKTTLNSLSVVLAHYHYDIFEAHVEKFDLHMKVAFSTNVKGDIDTVSMPLEPAVKEIVFKRIASKQMSEKAFLEQFVGTYEVSGVNLFISLKGDNTLFIVAPGQPEYELVPYKGTIFQLKGLSGFGVEFIVDAQGKVTEALLTQPYGVVTAKKQ